MTGLKRKEKKASRPPAMFPVLRYVPEARRIFFRRLKVLFNGVQRYEGPDVDICRSIIDDCYNKEKEYFMTSNGHFCEFYVRDFGWSVESLLKLGYGERVRKTLEYVMETFEDYGSIEQVIDPYGRPFTYPLNYSPDAVSFLIRSLNLADSIDLIERHKDLLNRELINCFKMVVDKRTGLVRRDRAFVSMKDYSLRVSSCYDNVMIGMLSEDLKEIGILENPFARCDYRKLLIENFWTGEYFLDDLSKHQIICGDANVIPFWTSLIKRRDMLRKAMYTIMQEGLANPFPLRFTDKRYNEQKMVWEEFFAGDYQRSAIWPHIGMMFIDLMRKIDIDYARNYLGRYQKLIEKYRNFLEVYNRKGKPFSTVWFYTDESMIWAANYLYLKETIC